MDSSFTAFPFLAGAAHSCLTGRGPCASSMLLQRDLLPACTAPEHLGFLAGADSGGTSVSAKRKRRAKLASESWLIRGLRSLNELGGHPAECTSPPTEIQKVAISQLAKRYHTAGPPDASLEPARAFQNSLGARQGIPAHATVPKATRSPTDMELPNPDSSGVDISSVLPPPWDPIVANDQGVMHPPSILS